MWYKLANWIQIFSELISVKGGDRTPRSTGLFAWGDVNELHEYLNWIPTVFLFLLLIKRVFTMDR